MADCQPFDSDAVYSPVGPFSHGSAAGDFVFVSGTGGLNRDGVVVSDDVAAQARAMMENTEKILAEDGLTFDDVVKTNLYLTNMDDYGTVNDIYAEYMPETPPARTCVEVSRLPVQERVKIEVIAYEG
ncbi:RidA family protein [Haloplanus halobius]|uniref:RidA family protein n=1 Tax=Haloplanus halobius TaxID=2934938 RepID=UPI00200DCD19|nr:RidA family protein [Haloplanus sp. XH21]